MPGSVFTFAGSPKWLNVPCASSNEAIVDLGAVIEDGDGIEQSGKVSGIDHIPSIGT
jgi:hypothetical protein